MWGEVKLSISLAANVFLPIDKAAQAKNKFRKAKILLPYHENSSYDKLEMYQIF